MRGRRRRSETTRLDMKYTKIVQKVFLNNSCSRRLVYIQFSMCVMKVLPEADLLGKKTITIKILSQAGRQKKKQKMQHKRSPYVPQQTP